MTTRSLIYALILGVFISTVFWIYPSWDVKAAAFFYRPALSSFVWAEAKWLSQLRHIIDILIYAFNALLALFIVIKCIWPKIFPSLQTKTAVYLLVCFLVVPGLIVNGVLKNHWGRPRPRQIVEWGGDKIFQPVWKISHQCTKNCSFTC